jgi:periplasmic protein CpxP/Spy
MKTLKAWGSLALVAVLMSGGSAFADGDMGKKFDKKLEKMKTELSLTEEQSTQIKAIFDQKKADIEAQHKAMEEKRKATHDQIAAVLNEDQKKKYEEMTEKMNEHKDHKKDGKKGDACCKVDDKTDEAKSE